MSSSRSPLPAAVLLAGSLIALVILGPDRALLPAAILPWGLAWGALLRLWQQHREWLGRRHVLLGGALALRLLFLASLPDLSDDLFRYVWDGLVSLQGVRPYSLVPSDPALAHLHGSELYRSMNSPDFHSIYPPLSQWIFLAGAGVHGVLGWPASAFMVKVGMTAMEFGGLVFMDRALRRSGRPAGDLSLYAWNPLVLLVIAGGGHSEGGLVLGLGLFLYGLSATPGARRHWFVWGGLALAILSKGLPLLLVPLAWRATGPRAFPAIAGVVAGAVLVSVPFLRPADMAGVLESVRLYTGLFEFNAGLYYLLEALGEVLPRFGTQHLGGGLAVAGLAGAGWIAIRHPVGNTEAAARAGLAIFTVWLLAATTVHPWYLVWVLVFLPFTPLLRQAWLWASGAVFLTYLTYIDVPHRPLVAIVWGGWLLLALHGEREWVLAPLRRRAARRKARWVAPFLAGRRMVDVGGGEGHVAEALSSDLLRACVVDPMQIAPADGAALPRIRGIGEALPLADGSVDSVLLSFVLHHARDPDRVLAEAIRICSRRVVILETTPRTRWGSALLRPLDRWVNSARGDGSMGRPAAPIRYRTAREWRETARELGARIVLEDRPSRFGHPVTRLVLEPRVPPPDQIGDVSL